MLTEWLCQGSWERRIQRCDRDLRTSHLRTKLIPRSHSTTKVSNVNIAVQISLQLSFNYVWNMPKNRWRKCCVHNCSSDTNIFYHYFSNNSELADIWKGICAINRPVKKDWCCVWKSFSTRPAVLKVRTKNKYWNPMLSRPSTLGQQHLITLHVQGFP